MLQGWFNKSRYLEIIGYDGLKNFRKHVCWEQLESKGKFLTTMFKQDGLGHVEWDK